MKNFMNVYALALGVVLKIAAIVAAIVLMVSLVEFLIIPQIFNGPEWVLWHWVTVPIPAITTFVVYIIGGAVYAAAYSLDKVWRNQPSQ